MQGSTLLGLLAAPSALVELLVDPARHILYGRFASSAIQVPNVPVTRPNCTPQEYARIVCLGGGEGLFSRPMLNCSDVGCLAVGRHPFVVIENKIVTL